MCDINLCLTGCKCKSIQVTKTKLVHTIALFTDNIFHLHYKETEHECEAISGKNDKIARNCLVSMLHCIVMQVSKVICEKGYSKGLVTS